MPGSSAASTTRDPGDTLIVVVSGRVKVVIHPADGDALTLTVIRPGGRRSLALALAREPGYPAGEARALAGLSIAAVYADDLHSALRLARSRDAGDPGSQAHLLTQMATPDEPTGRTGDAAAHPQEGLQLAARPGDGFELLNGLDYHGYLCTATGRCAGALTLWAALAALLRHGGFTEPPAEARRRHEPRCWTRCGRRARSSRPPRWPTACRGQACSSSSASKKAARIGSGSAGRLTAAQPSQRAGTIWTDTARVSNT
jgi:hypothetical protein